MSRHTHTKQFMNRGIWLGLALVCLLATAGTALAQSFIEPSAPPAGGRAATFLDTSSTTQRKLGSLIVGDQTSDKLCLNASSSSSATQCIGSWYDLIATIGGPFIRTNPNAAITIPADPNNYNPYFQGGYFRIQGNASSPADTLIATANLTYPGTAVGAFGTDNRDTSNYGAYFSGKLVIDKHFELVPSPDILGEICLNASTPYNPASPAPRFGCIDQWTDLIGAPAGPYVQLQASNPPTIQVGSARLSKAWQFGAAVVGDMATTTMAGRFCSDGLCSTHIGETAGTCPADCGGFSGLSAESGSSIDECQLTGNCDSGSVSPNNPN